VVVLAGIFACQGWAQKGSVKGASARPAAQDEATPAPLTKEQAKELFRSVDDILSFVSADTKLPISHSVKRKLITRDEVNKYLREKFEEIGRAHV